MRFWTVLITGVVLAAGCGDGTGPGLTVEDVAGAYTATTLTSNDGTGSVDQLALGATIQITLSVEGTTTGTIFIPGGNEDGSDFTADLAGTWTLNGQAVQFQHVADSFLKDVTFAFVNGTLTGSRFDGVITINLVLSR